MDLEIAGRHALLFDDDAQSAFVNSRSALVPWSGDPSLLIDRYDVRHLLSSIPKHLGRVYAEMEFDGVSRSDLDKERFLDLPVEEPDGDGNRSEGMDKAEEMGSGTYQAVPFSYGNFDGSLSNRKPDGDLEYSGYRPPFPLPETLLSCLPPTEKLHQIIARTAMFVSKHGGQSEIVLRVKQGDNPTFGFLMPAHDLHPYYRYLVEHPNLLSRESSPIDGCEEKTAISLGDNESKHASGALSLLGSVYGSLDEDDESSISSSRKIVVPANIVSAEKNQDSNRATLGDHIGSETKSSAPLKESTHSLRKNPPVVQSSSISANSKATVPTSSVNVSTSTTLIAIDKMEKMIVEPPVNMKETVSKLVEFILRNGREFEAVLIEQDRPHGRFPFLLPTNLYHSYYLKVLDDAQECKRLGKKSCDQKHDKQQTGGGRKSQEAGGSASQEVSASHSEGFYDSERKEKFKMVIGGSKKDAHDSSLKPPKESGVSVDMAAAIVMAATRGASRAEPRTSAKPSGISANAAAAIVMAATRGSSSPPDSSGVPSKITDRGSVSSLPPGQSVCSSSFGSLSALRNGSISASGLVSNPDRHILAPGNVSGSTAGKDIVSADSVKVANAIARNVALVAANEADSSEALLTKEQKLKAERLKRAKLFTSMIKSGVQDAVKVLPVTLVPSGTQVFASGSAHTGSWSDASRREREGSSIPVNFEAEDITSDHGSKQSYQKQTSRSGKDEKGDDGLVEREHLQKKKKHHSATLESDKEERRHKRHYRTSKSNDQESPSEDELPHRKKSRSGHHHRKYRDSSNDEYHGRSDSRWRKSHTEGKKESRSNAMETILEQPDSFFSKSPSSTSAVSGSRQDNAEISDDLRAKVRAMLLATL